jgi:hypothetical protein
MRICLVEDKDKLITDNSLQECGYSYQRIITPGLPTEQRKYFPVLLCTVYVEVFPRGGSYTTIKFESERNNPAFPLHEIRFCSNGMTVGSMEEHTHTLVGIYRNYINFEFAEGKSTNKNTCGIDVGAILGCDKEN